MYQGMGLLVVLASILGLEIILASRQESPTTPAPAPPQQVKKIVESPRLLQVLARINRY